MAGMKGGRMRGGVVAKGTIKKGTFPRLMKYVFKYYKWHLLAVLLCLVVSAGGGLVSSLFMQKNIDDIMNPGIVNGYESVAGRLRTFIIVMGSCYFLALLATFAYNRIMAVVTQGTLYHVRRDMFDKMETLPVKFFDTHAHGEIMSAYTNDTDALRQLVGQSIPTLLSSSLTLLVAVALMLWYSVIMSAVFVLCCVLMFFVVKKVGGASSKYMVAQQRSLGSEEGFVEEMMKGQKVVKVFTHEERAKADFDKYNEQLYADAKNAHMQI